MNNNKKHDVGSIENILKLSESLSKKSLQKGTDRDKYYINIMVFGSLGFLNNKFDVISQNTANFLSLILLLLIFRTVLLAIKSAKDDKAFNSDIEKSKQLLEALAKYKPFDLNLYYKEMMLLNTKIDKKESVMSIKMHIIRWAKKEKSLMTFCAKKEPS